MTGEGRRVRTARLPSVNHRADTSVPIHDLLAGRWSPRSFIPDHEVTDTELEAMLEAARWAPSAQNRQPRRFVVGRRGGDVHARLVASINERNQLWAPRASVLVLGLVERVGADGSAQPFADYDLGQAIAHLTIQAEDLGLSVRQMGGFHPDVAARELGLPAVLAPHVLVAVGRATPTTELEPDFVERDTAPRERLPVEQLIVARD